MPKIVQEVFFDGAEAKIRRLGLDSLIDEVRTVVTSFRLLILEKKNINSSKVVRRDIDRGFERAGGWTKSISGDIDWTKCKAIDGTEVCVGVEVQVSSRSDLIFRDVVHFKNQIIEGLIDLGILILPSDQLSYFLTDRVPAMKDGLRIVGEEMRAHDLPLMLIAIEHDGASDTPLPKAVTNLGKGKSKRQGS